MTPLALKTSEYNIILKSFFDYFMKPELKEGTKVETKQIIKLVYINIHFMNKRIA